MASVSISLAQALPEPKYTGDHEELPNHTLSRGPRILGAGALDQTQIVPKVSPRQSSAEIPSMCLMAFQRSGPPTYGARVGWRPRAAEDYGDGGAFPEIPMAQYPLDMGRNTSSTSNALALQVDAEGKVKYDALARQGHDEKRIV